jgi:DNA-3-methyladenine glycosylase
LLSKSFFARDAATVAKQLLGKILVHKVGRKVFAGKIVETEAYFGEHDPASRAYHGKKTALNIWMWREPGTVFVYMVHGQWLFNIITGMAGDPQGVLVRALEPINISLPTRGPGLLSRALRITNALNGLDVTDRRSPIQVVAGEPEKFKIGRSHRIGVSADLPRKLRFYIEGNPFVSRRL